MKQLPLVVGGPRQCKVATHPANLSKVTQATLATFVFAIPLVWWPLAERPFSLPKFVVMAVGAGVGAMLAMVDGHFRLAELPPRLRIGLALLVCALVGSALWGVLVSPYAFALQLFAIGWLFVLLVLRPAPAPIAAALAASATVVALIALLQFVGGDPFVLMGWPAQVGRMRVFATLGNPNFVAVFLLAALPLTLALRWVDPAWWHPLTVASAIQVAALVSTGSRAAVLGLLAVALFLATARRSDLRSVAAITAVALLILAVSPGRPLAETVRGRLYLWRVVTGHVTERPLLGFGPGTVEAMYVRWETAAWSGGQFVGSERRFAAAQDHIHNDYIEFAAESGIPACAAILIIVISFVAFARRHASRALVLGSGCGFIAIASAAAVDFPLHRPTELFIFWVLIGLALLDAAPSAVASRAER